MISQSLVVMLLLGASYTGMAWAVSDNGQAKQPPSVREGFPLQQSLEGPIFRREFLGQPWITSAGNQLPARLTSGQQRFMNAMRHASTLDLSLDESELDALLEEIKEKREPSSWTQWWNSMLNWLESLNMEHYDGELAWLQDFFQAITPSARTARILLYLVLAATCLAAGVLIVHELYLSGALSRRGTDRRGQSLNPKSSRSDNTGKTPWNMTGLPPKKQVAFLLQAAIEVLEQRGEIPSNPALTNDEIRLYLSRKQALAAVPFSVLIELAEPVLYGEIEPSRDMLLHCRLQTEHIWAL